MKPRIWILAAVLLGGLGQLAAAAAPLVGSAQGESPGEAAAPVERDAGEGAELWRSGDLEGAVESWQSSLNLHRSGLQELDPRERARLAYNLGVAQYRAEEPLRAAAWFEMALRLAPRWESARVNRDLARADAGLEPRDNGVVGTFVRRFTPGEAQWLALAGGLLVALAGALDALRGGAWRKAPWVALVALPVFWAPMLGHLTSGADGLAMVVAADGAALYGTPEASAERLGKLAPGDETRVLDVLPGWVKVVDRGEERWAPEDSVLSVIR